MSSIKENTNNMINIHLTNSDDVVTQNTILFEEWNKVIGIENHNSCSNENLESPSINIEIKQKHQNYVLAEIKDEDGCVCVVTTYITTLNQKKWKKFLEEICISNSLYKFSIDNTLNDILENKVISNYLVPIFPEELQYSGSCDNGIHICRHVKLLHQYLGFQMKNDPFYLLSLRGLTRMRFLTILKQMKINLFTDKSSSKLDNNPTSSFVSMSQDINTGPQSIYDEEKHPSNSLSKGVKSKPRFAKFYHIPGNQHQLNISGSNSTSNENLKDIVSSWNPISKEIIDREETSSPNIQTFSSSIELLMEHTTQEPTYYYHNQMFKAMLYNTGPIPKKNQFKLINNLKKIKGIGPKYAHALLQFGIDDIESLAKLEISQYLDSILKIPKRHLQKIIDSARNLYLKNKISEFSGRPSLPLQKENMTLSKNILTKIFFSNLKNSGLLQREHGGNLDGFLRNFEVCYTKNRFNYLTYYFYLKCLYVTNQGENEENLLPFLSNRIPTFRSFKPTSMNERIPKFSHDNKEKKIYNLIRSPRHLHELQSLSLNNTLFVQSELNTIKSTNKLKAFQSSPLNQIFNNNQNKIFQIMRLPTIKIHRIGGKKI